MVGVKVHNPITGTMKAVLVLGILGTLAYDGIQLGVRHVNAQDTADAAARAGEDVLFNRGSADQACAAANTYTQTHKAKVVADSCAVGTDSSIQITIITVPQKIILGRVVNDLSEFTVTGHAAKEA